MDTRKIGDLDVSIVGVGCNNFGRRVDRAGTEAVVHAAMEAGINFFDTADVYGDGVSEEYLSKALGSRRDEAIIATKFGAGFGQAAGLVDLAGLLQRVAVAVGFGWLTLLAVHLLRGLSAER